MGAVDAVVATHHGGYTRFHSGLERWIVQLPSRAVVDVGTLVHPLRLLLVVGKVLGDGHYALALDAVHVCRAQTRTQQGVLASHVLKIPAVSCHSVHLDSWTQEHVRALAAELPAHGRRHAAHQGLVPGGGQCQGRGPARRCASHTNRRYIVAETVASVCQLESRDAQAGHRHRVAHVVTLLRHDNAPAKCRPSDAQHEPVPLGACHLGDGLSRFRLGLLP
mmetsp:Transcript_71927/g.233804  ORF Transcript_71927/g.233804 Transcript_71927/m.233804 type:complete len:221 (-) Transcript_71927:190-852(-)